MFEKEFIFFKIFSFIILLILVMQSIDFISQGGLEPSSFEEEDEILHILEVEQANSTIEKESSSKTVISVNMAIDSEFTKRNFISFQGAYSFRFPGHKEKISFSICVIDVKYQKFCLNFKLKEDQFLFFDDLGDERDSFALKYFFQVLKDIYS